MAEATAAGRRPGPARSLSREQVVGAALEIMARDGLKGVSFRAISMRLGVDHKALYTYVADKDDLLSGMFEATVSSLDLPRADDARAPAEQLVDLLSSLRRSLMANVELVHLAGRRVTFGMERAAEGIWAALLAVVPDLDRAAELYTSLVQLTIGSAIDTTRAHASEADITALLAQLDAQSQPDLAAYARAMANVDRDRTFETTVRTLIRQAGPQPAT